LGESLYIPQARRKKGAKKVIKKTENPISSSAYDLSAPSKKYFGGDCAFMGTTANEVFSIISVRAASDWAGYKSCNEKTLKLRPFISPFPKLVMDLPKPLLRGRLVNNEPKILMKIAGTHDRHSLE
jgi:hypothetical protein